MGARLDSVFSAFVGWIDELYDCLNSVVVGLGSAYVGLADLLVAFIICTLILAVLWKGAKA